MVGGARSLVGRVCLSGQTLTLFIHLFTHIPFIHLVAQPWFHI